MSKPSMLEHKEQTTQANIGNAPLFSRENFLLTRRDDKNTPKISRKKTLEVKYTNSELEF